jgi:hypothetical protein
MIYPKSNLLKPPPSIISGTQPSGSATTPASLISTEGSVASGVSALTGGTGATGATGLSRAGTMVVNESPDPHLLALVPFNKKLKDDIGIPNLLPPMQERSSACPTM